MSGPVDSSPASTVAGPVSASSNTARGQRRLGQISSSGRGGPRVSAGMLSSWPISVLCIPRAAPALPEVRLAASSPWVRSWRGGRYQCRHSAGEQRRTKEFVTHFTTTVHRHPQSGHRPRGVTGQRHRWGFGRSVSTYQVVYPQFNQLPSANACFLPIRCLHCYCCYQCAQWLALRPTDDPFQLESILSQRKTALHRPKRPLSGQHRKISANVRTY